MAGALIDESDQRKVLSEQSNKIQSDIIQEEDQDKLKDLTHMFNVVQAKKNVIRASKLDEMYDVMLGEIQARMLNGGFDDNTEFLSAVKMVEGALNRAESKVNLVDELPAITLLQQNNVNVSGIDGMTKESRDRILAAVRAITTAKPDIIQDTGGDTNGSEEE